MKHFLITRFNLKSEEWKYAKDGSLVLTNQWLSERWVLFEIFCFPSVKNQTNKNFLWIVFFDIETEAKYKEKIHDLSLSFSNFKPIFISDMSFFLSSTKEIISKSINNQDSRIITTRLDNDDIIHQDFIKKIQLSVSKTNRQTVIDLSKGYQMQFINNRYFLKNFNKKFGPFISLVENPYNFETIISRKHEDWKNSKNVVCLNTTPLWIQLIHTKNKLNEMSKNSFFIKNIPNGFGLDINLKRKNYNILLSNLIVCIKYPLYVVIKFVRKFNLTFANKKNF